MNGSAIEVKTTSAKSNEKIRISSEHQLNPKDVENTLFLYVNMVRKSRSDGTTLPEIIKSIHSGISEPYRSLLRRNCLNTAIYLHVKSDIRWDFI